MEVSLDKTLSKLHTIHVGLLLKPKTQEAS